MKVMLDDAPVRFTPDGKIYLLDAIAALSGIDPAADVWEALVKSNPSIKEYTEDHCLPNEKPLQVMDSEGWEHIQDHLFEYLTQIRMS